MPLPAIELRSVRKTFGPKVAVENLDLTIPQGALIGLIGPNGAGKTTTIRMVMSILFADSGEISVLGKRSAIESKDRIGYLPEERGVYKKMRVGVFLEYMAKLKGVDSAGLETKARAWLDRLDLREVYRKKCEELSKGMQQKVQFVAAIIHEPDLLILDEPFSGLDPVNSRLLRTLVQEQHAAGKTVIFSTHQMSQAEALCDRIVMIHQGRKVLDDTPQTIRSRFTPREVHFEASPAWHANGTMPGIAGVESYEHRNCTHVAHLRDGTDPTTVIRDISAHLPVESIRAARPTLEDVFIEIVQRDAPREEREKLRELLNTHAKGDASGD